MADAREEEPVSDIDRQDVEEMIHTGGGKLVNPDELRLRRSAVKDVDRLTVVTKIHHEHIGEKPVAIGFHYNELLTQAEEPYTRRIKVDGDIPLPFGHVEEAHYVVVLNTSDQQITICFDGIPCLIVGGKKAVDFRPAPGVALSLRGENAACRVYVFSV